MVRVDFLATWVATGVAAFSAALLALNLTLPKPEVLSAVQMPILTASNSGETDLAVDREWPALFGAAVAAVAPRPDVGPVVNTTYALRGLVTDVDGGWAILADGDTETLIRHGDMLDDGSVVAQIDRHGVVLDLDGQMTNVSFATAEGEGSALVTAANPQAEDPRSILSRQVDLDVSDFGKSDMLGMLARAGVVTQVEPPDGISALDVVWSPSDQLDEKLGLQADDRLLRIDGIEVAIVGR